MTEIRRDKKEIKLLKKVRKFQIKNYDDVMHAVNARIKVLEDDLEFLIERKAERK